MNLHDFRKTRKLTISIIGFGNVGKCVLYQLLNESKHHFCINIIEPNQSNYGSFLDISHASFIDKQHQLVWNGQNLLAGSDFIFHCAGANIPLNSTRLSVIKESIAITTAIFQNFRSNVNPIIIVIANPVDIISSLTYQLTALDASRVIGTGTSLDTIRMNYYIEQVIGNNQKEIETLLLGEHGDSIVLMRSLSFIGKLPLENVIKDELVTHCINRMKNAATIIKETQGATYYAVAKCATSILNNILYFSNTRVPLSVLLPTQLQKRFKCPPLFMSIPTKLTKNGAFPVLDFKCSDEELLQLQISAQQLSRYTSNYNELNEYG
jgi:L-lactate dehydrogenase